MVEDELYDCRNELEEAENQIKEFEAELEGAKNIISEALNLRYEIDELLDAMRDTLTS